MNRFSKLLSSVINSKNGKVLHVFASAYFFGLLLSVVYSCAYIAYPIVYNNEDELKSKLFLFYLFVNIMGNYLLGVYVNSFFTSGLPFYNPPCSWHYCEKCKQYSPPRSHHCSICNACVLQQDHHCFFLCQCVGIRNQKFFIIFSLYVAIGSFHALKVMLFYLDIAYVPIKLRLYNISSYFLPMIVYNELFTDINVTPAVLFCLMVLYGCFSTAFGCTFLFIGECVLVVRGQTPFEYFKQKPTNMHLRRHIIQVFGKLWFLQFLLPLPIIRREKLFEESPNYKTV